MTSWNVPELDNGGGWSSSFQAYLRAWAWAQGPHHPPPPDSPGNKFDSSSIHWGIRDLGRCRDCWSTFSLHLRKSIPTCHSVWRSVQSCNPVSRSRCAPWLKQRSQIIDRKLITYSEILLYRYALQSSGRTVDRDLRLISPMTQVKHLFLLIWLCCVHVGVLCFALCLCAPSVASPCFIVLPMVPMVHLYVNSDLHFVSVDLRYFDSYSISQVSRIRAITDHQFCFSYAVYFITSNTCTSFSAL